SPDGGAADAEKPELVASAPALSPLTTVIRDQGGDQMPQEQRSHRFQPSARRLWLRDPLAVHLGAGAKQDRAERGIVIDRDTGTIVELVPAGGEPAGGAGSVAEVVDASAHVTTPGLTNTRHTSYQTLTGPRAPAPDLPLYAWLRTLSPLGARVPPPAPERATTSAMAELRDSGCTTAADHHYLFPTGLDAAIDIQVDAVRALGMRAMLTRGSMSLGEKDGGLPPQQTVQDAEVILADSRRLVEAYHGRGAGAQGQIAFAPDPPLTVTSALLRATADVPLQPHVR